MIVKVHGNTKQFCLRGHDTSVTGRHSNRACKVCQKDSTRLRLGQIPGNGDGKVKRPDDKRLKRFCPRGHDRSLPGALIANGVCKICHRKRTLTFYYDNKEQRRAVYFLNKYGITLEQHAEMVSEQDGKCFICEKVTAKLWVDHNHETGEVRKLLCNECNFALGLTYENPIILRRLADYAEIHNGRHSKAEI